MVEYLQTAVSFVVKDKVVEMVLIDKEAVVVLVLTGGVLSFNTVTVIVEVLVFPALSVATA